jgi:hypothetical protein
MALAGRQWLPPGPDMAAGAAQVARAEQARVSGELYWVSAAMTALACHAAPSLPSRDLHAHDLPSPAGLMIFEAPLAGYVNGEGREVEIAAVTWGPWDGPDGAWDQGGIWLTFWAHPAPALPRAAFAGGTASLAAPGPAGAALPPVMPDNEAGWPFGDLPAGQQVPAGTTASWALAVRAAFRLMRQPLAAQSAEEAPRGTRRRLARAGLPDTGVRVVRVRRREQSPGPRRDAPGGGRDYDAQWWVTGHWRRYWCGPGRTRPEDRWIDPYLAGPDDKPVRGTERVRVWDR